MNKKIIPLEDYKLAVKIRSVEEKLLNLFSEGSLNGTVHTCIGQELSAVAICKDLESNDYVFSNHRCHGHYIAFSDDYKGLLSELLGKKNGIVGGIGGSQHICNKNFFSNGPQGVLSPVAVGVAYANKILKNNKLTICFIGDGTLGEGIIYESMNIASLYNLPILFVCENNYYAQSTPISNNLAGSIIDRAKAFGLKVVNGNTWDYQDLSIKAKKAIEGARNFTPHFFEVETYRLKAHSKGDDDRDKKEIEKYRNRDLICQELKNNKKLVTYYKKINQDINQYLIKAQNESELDLEEYLFENKLLETPISWKKVPHKIVNKQIEQINDFFKSQIKRNKKILLIGEDILDPYGGAFKATKGLTDLYKENIISTPISEAAIVGMGIGLSLIGFKPFVEIMFGDFLSYSFDQIISNASKFYHMYNKQVSVPLVVRAPMGGRRGYGPTHSQSIEKHFNGINNISIVALNTFIEAGKLFQELMNQEHTTILIENKIDYGRLQNKIPKCAKYEFKQSISRFPIVVGEPLDFVSELSIITYGGTIHPVLESIDKIFYEHEFLPTIILLSQIYPLQINEIRKITSAFKYILTVEEGSVEGGFGSEIISSLAELNKDKNQIFARIGSKNVPIPSTKQLEDQVLVNSDDISKKLSELI